jgi:hypothetical protein
MERIEGDEGDKQFMDQVYGFVDGLRKKFGGSDFMENRKELVEAIISIIRKEFQADEANVEEIRSMIEGLKDVPDFESFAKRLVDGLIKRFGTDHEIGGGDDMPPFDMSNAD